ncbi:MAG TPA: hypothetical protein DCR93_16310, partial [Cytophagales bacterium]|nr:hypothetical protein [Cytophagales bacterium]
CHLGVANGSGTWSNREYLKQENGGLADINRGVDQAQHLTESPILDYYDASKSKDIGCDFDRDTVGIELINFGWVEKSGNKWKNYLGGSLDIEDSDVVTYGYASTDQRHKSKKGYRGKPYYLKYTQKQIASLKQLLVYLALENDVPLKNEKEAIFQLNRSALTKQPGIYTHSSVRIDKFDCHPQPELIEMLKEIDALGHAIEFLAAIRASILDTFPVEEWLAQGWLNSQEEAEAGVDRWLDILVKSYVAREDLTQVEREVIQKYIQPEVIGEAAAVAEKLFFALSAANYRKFLDSYA